MDNYATTTKCWPTKEQEWLLRACLLTGDDALAAWQQWKNVFEKGTIDKGSHRLLPLLYRNLHDQGIDDVLITGFKEECYRTWSLNQFCLQQAAALIREFNHAGIQSMLLKGAALIILFYEDAGLRPMADVDLLVTRAQAKRSIQLLTDLGWTSQYSSPKALIPFEQATDFRNASNQNLDLHWRLMWEGNQHLNDDEFWTASITVELNGVQAQSLNPADHLLHVCVHGAKWNDTPSLRWVADAMMIIRCRKFEFDWARLVHQAQNRQLTLPMRDTLTYLHNLLDAPIPSEVLISLQSTPTSKVERWFYHTRLKPNDTLRMIPVLSHWINSLRVDCDGHLLHRFLQFSQYLQTLWSVKRQWQTPFYLVAKPIKRIYQTLKAT